MASLEPVVGVEPTERRIQAPVVRRHYRQFGAECWDRTSLVGFSDPCNDHTCSLCEVELPEGIEPSPTRYEGAFPPWLGSRRWSKIEESNPALSLIRQP